MKLGSFSVGQVGVDCDTVLDSSSAPALKAAGLFFVVRYLGSLSAAELSTILAAGLAVQLVTFSRAPGWTPSAELGTQDGATDVQQLATLSVPQGVTVWIDLEGVNPATPNAAAAVMAYVEARAAALVAAGYVAGLYVGAGSLLTGASLYKLTGVTRYWQAFNQGIPEVATCGYCQEQLYPPDQTISGIEVDYDVVSSDYLGRYPTGIFPGDPA